MSEEYLNWMSNFSKRELTSLDKVFPLTVKKDYFSLDKIKKAKKWWEDNGVNLSHNRRFCFIGSFMSVFDFDQVKDAIILLEKKTTDFQIVIAGSGDFHDEITCKYVGMKNVIFPGWIDAPKIYVLAKHSRGSIIPYKNIDNFTMNIPNKVVDALANSLPIITTLEGAVANLVNEYHAGFSCNPKSGIKLHNVFENLLYDDLLFEKISKNAYCLFKKKFNYDLIYGNFAKHLEKISNPHE